MDVLSSKSATDAASDSSSSSFADLNDHSNIAPSPSREVDPHVFLLHFTPVLDQAAFFWILLYCFFLFYSHRLQRGVKSIGNCFVFQRRK
jgi:hypothetical protein